MDAAPQKTPLSAPIRRRFLGVYFRCCNVYSRLYCNHDKTAYTGRCPRCGKQARIPIGDGGTSSRFFEVQ